MYIVTLVLHNRLRRLNEPRRLNNRLRGVRSKRLYFAFIFMRMYSNLRAAIWTEMMRVMTQLHAEW